VLDYEEALSRLASELDAVDICTPTKRRCGQAMAALDAGLRASCERPLAPTAREAREVASAARRGLQVVADPSAAPAQPPG